MVDAHGIQLKKFWMGLERELNLCSASEPATVQRIDERVAGGRQQ